MSEEEQKSIEELEAEYREVLDKKIKAFKAEQDAKDAEEAKKAADEAEQERKEAFQTELQNTLENVYKITKPDDGTADMQDDAETTIKTRDNKYVAFRENYLKKHKIETKPYGFGMQTKDGFAFTDSDTGCEDDISAWKPADVFCDLMWQEASCGKQLSGVITVQACDISAGDGLSVQIRTIDSSEMGSELGACECASCSSNVFSTYSLTLKRYDVYKVLCGLNLFSVGEGLQSAVVESMSRAFATGIDSLIWTAISGASPTCSQTLAAAADCDASRGSDGACCAYAADLYKAIVDAEASLRAAGYGADGFYLVLSPTVAAFLKYKEGINAPAWINNIQMEGNKLMKIGDIKVIEYCGATACTDKASEVMAILLDPERAVGEAYGKRPQLLTDSDPIECDSQKLVMRTYVAVSALDADAICHIKNPSP